MLTTMVRAVSRSRPCPSVWKKTPRLSAARSMETRTTLQSRKGESSGAFASRGRRSIVPGRSEEHTSELQSLMRISYAVFCLKKKKKNIHHNAELDTETTKQKK